MKKNAATIVAKNEQGARVLRANVQMCEWSPFVARIYKR